MTPGALSCRRDRSPVSRRRSQWNPGKNITSRKVHLQLKNTERAVACAALRTAFQNMDPEKEVFLSSEQTVLISFTEHQHSKAGSKSVRFAALALPFDAVVTSCKSAAAGGDSQCSSKDSLLDSEGGQEEDSTQEGGSTDSGDRETLDNENEKTVPKGVESEETMGFAGRIEGPPNDGKGLEAVPTGLMTGHRATSVWACPWVVEEIDRTSSNHREVEVSHHRIQVLRDRMGSQYSTCQDKEWMVRVKGPRIEEEVMGTLPMELHQDRQMEGDNSQLNKALVDMEEVTGQAQTVLLGIREPPQSLRMTGYNIPLATEVSLLQENCGQDVRFSCVLPPDIDPSICEFRWTKRDQVDCVARGQNWNRAVQHCDVGVYTCEVTTPGGEVLDGQAELVIIEDNAAGGVVLPGPSRRPRNNDNDHTPRKRPRTAGPGAQGFSASSGQIQGIHQLPLEAILDEEDLLSNLRILLEQSDRHYRNIGSHFGLTRAELEFIEFTELRGKDSPLRAILQKVTQTDESKTVGELLQYCDEKLKRRDVVKTVVDYFVKKENQEIDMKVKEGVVADNLHQVEECSKRGIVDSEMKEVGSQSAAMDVPEESLSDSESSVAHKKLGTCDFNTEAIELVEIPPVMIDI
ncbi:hypothetical protein Bbelb_397740 [Branchiostoma belcheri]|nr:hypothetical protein Bbelb_397740 [Branchiostoma belcheri]